MSTCPDCGRERAHGGDGWAVDYGAARRDEVARRCGAHLPGYWSDETIPDCKEASIVWLRAQLTEQEARIAELQTELAVAVMHGKNLVSSLRHLEQSPGITDREFRLLLRERLPQRLDDGDDGACDGEDDKGGP